MPLERLAQLRRRRLLAQLAAAVELEVQVAIRRLVRSLLGAVQTTVLTEELHLVLLERQVLVEGKTKAATFWQLLVEPVARLTLLEMLARVDCQHLEATDHQREQLARQVVRQLLPAAAAVRVVDNLRLTVMDLRRLTVAQVAHQVLMALLVLRAALQAMERVALAAAVAAAAGRLPVVLKVVLAVLVALALTDT